MKKKKSQKQTYELHGFVQPRQDLLAEAVVDGYTQEVRLRDEVGFGTRVAGVEDVRDVVLLHQILWWRKDKGVCEALFTPQIHTDESFVISFLIE